MSIYLPVARPVYRLGESIGSGRHKYLAASSEPGLDLADDDDWTCPDCEAILYADEQKQHVCPALNTCV